MNKNTLLALMLLPLLLSGCSTSKDELLPPGDNDMKTTWQSRSGGGLQLADARSTLRRPLNNISAAEQATWSRSAKNEIYNQFQRLPNPDLVMYVFPHMATGDAPVPGYSTVFPLYIRTWYALPGEGERTEEL